jgi:hypothetical protein
MAQMIRKQVYVEARHDVILKRLARAKGVTEAEIIRKALEREAISVSADYAHPDPRAWEAVRTFIRRLIAKGPAAGGRKWAREELYQERLKRYGR